MSLALECLTVLHGGEAKPTIAALDSKTFLQCYVWRMQLCHGRSKLRSASVERKPSRRWEPPDWPCH